MGAACSPWKFFPAPLSRRDCGGWHWLSEPERRHHRAQLSRRAEPVCGGGRVALAERAGAASPSRSALTASGASVRRWKGGTHEELTTRSRHPASPLAFHPVAGPPTIVPRRMPSMLSGVIVACAVTYACHRYPTAAGLACGAGLGKITAVLASERRAITFSCAVFPKRPHGALNGRGRYGHCPHTEGLPHGRLRSS